MSSQIVDEAVISLPRRSRHWSKAQAEHLEREERRRAVACVERMTPDHVEQTLEALGLAPSQRETTIRQGDKRCSACREVKPRGEFYRASNKKDGHHSQCKTCHSGESAARNRQRRAAEAQEANAS